MIKVIELKTNRNLFYKHYLKVLNGVSGLSDQELTLLAELFKISEIDDNVLEHLDKVEGLTDRQVKLLINKFKDKKILVMLGDHFHINKNLYVPREECDVTFRFKFI